MKKILLAILLICILFIGTGAAAYSGSGSGTASDPYIITTPAQLQSMKDGLTSHYQLGNDIDMTTWLQSNTWTPIGGSSSAFSGSLDGNGHTISNLNSLGIARYATDDAIFKNLRVEYPETLALSLSEHTGGIVGILKSSHGTGMTV